MAEEGFGIVEALVAAIVLVTGLLGALLTLNVAVHASQNARAREGAVTLARELTEDARSIPYSQIASTSIASDLQAMPNMSSSSSGSAWTISRRGFTYTVTASVTTINDAMGDASGSTDFKQVSVTVSWTQYQGKAESLTEVATVSAAGQDPGLATSSLQVATSGISNPTAPTITSPTVGSLQFSVTAPSGTDAIVWTLNGNKMSAWNGSTPSSGTTWTSTAWSLSGVSDGSYTVGAAAEDANGLIGPEVTIPVQLIRGAPSAPNVTNYGFNPKFPSGSSTTTAAELQWSANPEVNVTGYEIYAPGGSSPICTTTVNVTSDSSCGTSAWCLNATTCVDLSPPSVNASNLTYKVVALYYDANNTLQQGTARSVTLASGTPATPNPPASVTVTALQDGTANVTWTPPSGGTAVTSYWIYRDGTSYTSRYESVLASSCSTTCTYHDVNRSTSHSYSVTAVGGTTAGSNVAESTATGPVSG